MAAFNKFNQFVEDLAEKVHNLGADTIKVLLVKNTYGFAATQNIVNDITPATHEVTGGGYARQTLTTKTVTEDDTNNRAALLRPSTYCSIFSTTRKRALPLIMRS